MKRSIATCKSCGTQFAMVGEISGCLECGHSELAIQPEPGDWKELEKAAADMSNEEIDAFMASLEKDHSLTKKFLAELEAEYTVDEAVRELMEDFDPTPAERTDWSKKPHHSHCCCDKCAPTKEDRDRIAADFDAKQKEFDLDQCLACGNDCDGCAHEASLKEAAGIERMVKARKPKLKGNCRTCARWNKIVAQAGSCRYRVEADRPTAPDGLRVSLWYETCGNYLRNTNYIVQQVEIRERRKAHNSILKAMERNRS